jgi:hypothetical protein
MKISTQNYYMKKKITQNLKNLTPTAKELEQLQYYSIINMVLKNNINARNMF